MTSFHFIPNYVQLLSKYVKWVPILNLEKNDFTFLKRKLEYDNMGNATEKV